MIVFNCIRKRSIWGETPHSHGYIPAGAETAKGDVTSRNSFQFNRV